MDHLLLGKVVIKINLIMLFQRDETANSMLSSYVRTDGYTGCVK